MPFYKTRLMEELEFWVGIFRKIGIKPVVFKEIKEKTLEIYSKVQYKLAKTQESLSKTEIDTTKNFSCIEKYILDLKYALKKQDSIILLFSLSSFLKKIKKASKNNPKRVKSKRLLSACNEVIKRLGRPYSFLNERLNKIGIKKIEKYKFLFEEILNLK